MKTPKMALLSGIGLLALWCTPAHATVQLLSFRPALKPPQTIGTPITWTVTATDTNPGPLAFQFNLGAPGATSYSLILDFNVGTLSAGTWTSPPFLWTPTGIEGTYKIQVIAKDFTSGESATGQFTFQVNPLVTGSTPVVVPTGNPLVALFSAPSCPAGSSMRVSFSTTIQQLAPAFTTNWVTCHPPNTMTFEIAGMYPNTTYQMNSQTITGTKTVNGASVSFTTGNLPTNIPFPTFNTVIQPGSQTYTGDPVLLINSFNFGGGAVYPEVATDLSGKIIWYYYPHDSNHVEVLTRPLQGGAFLAIQSDSAWNPASQTAQFLRQFDLAGNVTKETNTGAIQQQLLALGVTDAQPCNAIPSPAPVGSACLGSFHHDAIQSLPKGYTAVIADIEKIFPPGTQGDTSGLPVDIVGDMIIVLNANWQVFWYWDAFDHAGGCPVPPATGACQLDINRPAVLGDTCVINQQGCPPIFLLGPGIAPRANDWLHANSLYYWPNDTLGGASGDLVWSSRHQDWILKIDYNNGLQTGGLGTGNILWRLGLDGDFTFLNNYGDPWPWFSHQHDVGIESNGDMTIFDNGNTRISAPPLGLGVPGCQPADCNSRGMSLAINETNMTVTPQLSVDLGVYSTAMGSAQLLPNGSYFFLPAIVVVTLNDVASDSIEILPTPGTDTGPQVLNLQGPEAYRAWRVASLYTPPAT